MKSAGSERRLDEDDVSKTAYGPADVRDTPHVKRTFPTEDEETEQDDPWIGRVLSNVYEIEAKIGEGGMGSVYLARHVHLQKAFAVKVLADTVASKDNAVERLRQEAMAAARIDHENIVDVVNFDRTEEGAVFIVMEMLEGENLADAIGRGPIELHRALPITFQICRALHAAHEHAIVHRDLKPENVFLTRKSGRTLVKVLDFGISKIKSAEAEEVKMTKTGQLVGTPLYMSPEQARGETEIDRRVDVYAMGVMLFEMLAGAPPFEGRNYFELLWKHGNEPPPLLKDLNPNVYLPDALEDVLARALDKDRDARFQTMEELEHALMEAAPEVPSLPPMPSLPPEGGPRDRDAVRLGHAKTEMVQSSDAGRAPSPSEEVRLPARGRAGLWVAAAAVALLAVGGAVALSMGDEPTPTADEAADGADAANGPDEADGADGADGPGEAEAPEADDGETLAGTEPPEGVDPPPAEAPARVSVHLSSTPEGAEVRVGDRTLGTTPLVTPLEASDEPIRLTFAKRGYLSRTISVVVDDGVEVPAVRLRRRRSAQTTSDGTGSPLPIKTGL